MVKPREKRVPIMMSEEEMTAVDDWRFANRVATRSDAIRRLCQMGIAFHEKGAAVLSLVAEDMNRLADLQDAQADILKPLPEGTEISREHALQLAAASLEACSEYEEILSSTLERIGDLLRESEERGRADLPPGKGVLARVLASIRHAITERD